MVDIRDASTNTVLAQSSVTVIVGGSEERYQLLGSCDGWNRVSQLGGSGVTIDNWDISAVPDGAVFDLRYEALGIPDKFLVNYPDGNQVLDSGWRGNSRYDGATLYPGGVVGDGDNAIYNLFPCLAQDSFRVTVIGPDIGTLWKYEVRCRTPQSTGTEVCSSSDDCPSSACAYESFSPDSSMVCCAAGASTRISVSISDEWPSFGYHFFCRGRPEGICVEYVIEYVKAMFAEVESAF